MATASRYTPPTSFRPMPLALVHDFVARRALCTLIGNTSTGLHASHLPCVLDRTDDGGMVLRGHVARANLGWLNGGASAPGLAIFAGEDDYGVPGDIQQAERAARPIELLGAVHLYGEITLVEGHGFLLANMEALTNRHAAGRAHPWNSASTPADVMDRMVRQVIGVEFHVARAEACDAYGAVYAPATACESGN
jgi:transcriptional regulator